MNSFLRRHAHFSTDFTDLFDHPVGGARADFPDLTANFGHAAHGAFGQILDAGKQCRADIIRCPESALEDRTGRRQGFSGD